jgi:hypothetical protein
MPHGTEPGATDGPQGPDRSRGLSRRSGIWLTTLSTALAVATGMFTLRDQIFPPRESVGAPASVELYEHSVASICSALNHADRARARSARRLATRLPRARSTLAQRNALLDSTKQVLVSSEHQLASFTALDVPGVLMTRQRETAAAWDRIVARLRGYAQRLDAASGQRDLLAVVRTLPRTRTALARDRVTRARGLTNLGGGRCRLDQPISTPTITLPRTRLSVSPPSLSATVTPSVETAQPIH